MIQRQERLLEADALLVSDRAKFITGANYRVDGGMTGGLTNVQKARIIRAYQAAT